MPREITEAEAETLAMARAAYPPGTKLEWGWDENGEWCILELGDAIQCTGPLLAEDDLNTRGRMRMPRYWIIAPVESKPSEMFDAVWQFDLANSCITIGWSKLGDVSQYSREQLLQALNVLYAGSKRPTTLSLYTNMIWNFFHEIQIGDVILARRGRKILEAVGTVRALGHFSDVVKPGFPKGHTHRFFLGVTWSDEPREKHTSVLFFLCTLSLKSRQNSTMIYWAINNLPAQHN